MSNSEELSLEKGSIPRLLLKFSLPAVVGMLVNALYNVIDSAFVGRGVGELALAGVTITFPIVLLMIAFIMLIAMGATSLISIRLGEDRGDDAELIVGNSLTLFFIVGIIMTALGLIFLEPLLFLFGSTKDVLPYAAGYTKVILFGSIPMALGVGMNNFIRAEGSPKTAMKTMLIGAFTNIILDYFFIFIFEWGIKGAALATVLSHCLTALWVLYYFFSGNSVLKIRRENLKVSMKIFKEIAIVGFPAFAMQMTTSVQHLVLNRTLSHYGGDLALAAIGIIMSLTTLLMMPTIGISQGVQPIIGFNYGAKKYDRVKDTLKLSIIVATIIMTIGFLITRFWPGQLIGLFNQNPELIELGTHAMLIFFLCIPLVSTQVITASYFQATGKPRQSTLLTLSRQVIIFIPLVLILPRFFDLEGVWISSPLADTGAFILSITWLWFEIRSLNKTQALQENAEK